MSDRRLLPSIRLPAVADVRHRRTRLANDCNNVGQPFVTVRRSRGAGQGTVDRSSLDTVIGPRRPCQHHHHGRVRRTRRGPHRGHAIGRSSGRETAEEGIVDGIDGSPTRVVESASTVAPRDRGRPHDRGHASPTVACAPGARRITWARPRDRQDHKRLPRAVPGVSVAPRRGRTRAVACSSHGLGEPSRRGVAT